MNDPDAIRQRNIDISNQRYTAFKATAVTRGIKLPQAMAEAIDLWLGVKQAGVDETRANESSLTNTERSIITALRRANLPEPILQKVARILEGIIATISEASTRRHTNDWSPEQEKELFAQRANEIPSLSDKPKRPPAGRRKPGNHRGPNEKT